MKRYVVRTNRGRSSWTGSFRKADGIAKRWASLGGTNVRVLDDRGNTIKEYAPDLTHAANSARTHRDRRALSAYQRVVHNRLVRKGLSAARAEQIVRAYHAQIAIAKRQGRTTKWVAAQCAKAARKAA